MSFSSSSLKSKQIVAEIFFTVFILIYFYPTLFYSWVGLDDFELIHNNTAILNNDIFSLLTNVNIAHFHPATNLWLWAFYQMGGLIGIKLSCFLLFFLCAYNFFQLIKKNWKEDSMILLWVCLLWALHPLSAEVLYWATGPKELLGCLGVLLSLRFFNRPKTQSLFIWMAAVTLAILSKSTWTLLLPFYLVWHLKIKRQNELLQPHHAKGFIWITLIAFFAGFMTYFGHKTLSLHADLSQVLAQVGQETLFGEPRTFEQFFSTLLFYLGRWFLPINLVPFFQSDHTTFFALDLIGPLALAIMIIISIQKKWPMPYLALLSLLALLPVIGIVPFGYKQAQSCRYMFFSLPFLIYFFLCFIKMCLGQFKFKNEFAHAINLILAIVFLFLSLDYRKAYSNEENFNLAILKHQPNSSIALNGLGKWYAVNGDNQKALDYFKKAIDKDPNYLQANFNLGLFYLKKGDCPSAKSWLDKALKLNQKFQPIQKALKYCDQQMKDNSQNHIMKSD